VQRYVLTERGKLLIAMLVVLFIILPTILVIVWVVTHREPHDEYHEGSNNIQQDGSLIPSEQSNGHVNPDYSGQDARNNSSAADALQDDAANEVIAFDLSAGTMTFRVTAGMQVSLDASTVSKIGELLTSSQNTTNSKIVVEIPQLSENESRAVTTAITDAFETHEVPLSDIVFFVYSPPDSHSQIFDINISFRQS